MRQIEGRNPVLEALRASTPITEIYTKKELKKDERISEIIEIAKKKNIPVTETDIKDLSQTGRDQGIIAMAEFKDFGSLQGIIEKAYEEERMPLVIILSGIVYEHNLGRILRTAESTGVDAVIMPKNGFGLTPAVVKASAGASEHIPLFHENLFSTLKLLRKKGCKVIGMKEGKNKSIYNTNLNIPLVIVLGAEDEGIKPTLDKYIDEYISLPMKGKIESLNVAVAASVCLYEVIRQKNQNL